MKAALFLFSLLAFGAAVAAPPNILFICVDDLKPVLGCYGDAVAKTPNLDRLAGRGLRFDAAYCNQAVCSPSRNALMTSLRPQTLGIYELSTNFRKAAPDAVTVAQHFMAQGYRTEAMGKIFHRGHGNVEDAASWSVPHWNPKAATYALAESTANLRESRNGPRGPATELAEVDDAFYADGLLAREAARRLEAAAAKPDQPFFIAVGFIRPHLPFVAPKKYWDLYDPATLPMPKVTEPPAGAPAEAWAHGDWGGQPLWERFIAQADGLRAQLESMVALSDVAVRPLGAPQDGGWLLRGVPRFDAEGQFEGHVGTARAGAAAGCEPRGRRWRLRSGCGCG